MTQRHISHPEGLPACAAGHSAEWAASPMHCKVSLAPVWAQQSLQPFLNYALRFLPGLDRKVSQCLSHAARNFKSLQRHLSMSILHRSDRHLPTPHIKDPIDLPFQFSLPTQIARTTVMPNVAVTPFGAQLLSLHWPAARRHRLKSQARGARQ